MWNKKIKINKGNTIPDEQFVAKNCFVIFYKSLLI